MGNLLGAGLTHQASLAATLCVISGTLFQGCCGVLMYVLRSQLGYIFTSDPNVVEIVSSIVLFGVAFQVGHKGCIGMRAAWVKLGF